MMIGNNIIRLVSVDSTNRFLKDTRRQYANGTVIFTNEQTGGRGRQQKKWLSLPGKSLTFSFLLSQSHDKMFFPFFHLFPAVAVVQCLQKCQVDAQIKWPNDIYVAGKKIGGLLVESISQAHRTDVLVGIGLNVLHETDDFPAELREHAGSIKSVARKIIDMEYLFQQLLLELNVVFTRFNKPEALSELRTVWSAACAHLNQNITIFQKSGRTTGRFIGLDENGFAVIETDGKKMTIQDYEFVSMRDEHDTRN